MQHFSWEEKVPSLLCNVCHWYGLGNGSMLSAMPRRPSSELWYLFVLTIHKHGLVVKTSNYRIILSQTCS